MPKYLIQANYKAEGIKGLLKQGGSNRRASVEKSIQSMGGTVEAFYFAFGDTDVYVIVDLPDNAAAAALALAVSSAGTVSCKTTVLMTPEEVDVVAKKTPKYRPPGH